MENITPDYDTMLNAIINLPLGGRIEYYTGFLGQFEYEIAHKIFISACVKLVQTNTIFFTQKRLGYLNSIYYATKRNNQIPLT